MAKVILFEVRIDGTKTLIKNQKELKAAIRATNKALDGADIGSQRYKQLQRNLGGLKKIQGDIREETRKQQRAFVRAADAGKGSYRALQAELSDTKKEFRELSAAARDGIGGKKLLGNIQRLDKELKKIDRTLGETHRNVGNYQSAFSGAFKAIKGGLIAAGISVGLSEISRAVTDSIKVFSEFKDQLAFLGAVSGASAEELALLEAEAKRLGETTQFTASEVAGLQINFAKAGFDTSQIIAATEATLNLAGATGEDLVSASEVVAASLGGYGLAAEEAARVTDVMAASFNVSLLNLEKFRESTKLVGPVARLVGVEIEQVTGVLGLLADAGLDGSIAGTALRTIFAELGTEGSKLSNRLGVVVTDSESFNEALVRLGEESFKVDEATALVGKRAVSAFAVLAESSTEILQLSAGLAEVSGNAEKLGLTAPQLEELGIVLDDIPSKYLDIANAAETAAKAQDSLAGDQRKFASALEGLQIRIVDLFEDNLRAGTQIATNALSGVGDVIEFVIDLFRPLVTAIQDLAGELFQSGDAGGVFRDVLQRIGGALILVVNVVSFIIENFTLLVRAFNKVADSGTIVGKAFKFIKDVILGVSDAITQIPAFLNGLVTAFRQFRDNVTSLDFSLSISDAFREGFEDAQVFSDGVEKELSKAEKSVKDSTQKIAAAVADLELSQLLENIDTGNSVRSISVLSDEIANLKALIETATSRNLILEAVEELAKKEKDLNDLKNSYGLLKDEVEKPIKRVGVDEALEGSLGALKKEITDLRKEISGEIDKNVIEDKLEDLIGKERELNKLNDELTELEQTLRDVDFEEFGAISIKDAGERDEVEKKQREQEAKDLEAFLQEQARLEEEGIEKRRLVRLAGLREMGLDEDENAEQINIINLKAQAALLESRLASEQEGSVEFLALKQRIADTEIEIEKEKNDRLENEQDKLRLNQEAEAEKFRKKVIDTSFQSAKIIADTVFSLQTSRLKEETDLKLEALEEEFEQKKELVEGNAEAEAELDEEFARRKEIIEKEAAKKGQQIAIVQAIINTALAITKAFATIPPPGSFIAAGLAAIAGAEQITVIRSQTLAKGGIIEKEDSGMVIYSKGGEVIGKSHEQGGEKFNVGRSGRVVELEGEEGVINKKSMKMRSVVSMSGTPRQIASQLNVMGGGVKFGGGGVVASATGRLFQGGGLINNIPINLEGFGGGAKKLDVELSNDSVVRLGEAVAVGSEIGSERGSAKAVDESNRIRERQGSLDVRTNV